MKKMTREQYADIYQIVGAAMEVYNTLGRGLKEAVYHEAMQIELSLRNIPFQSEVWLEAFYKDYRLEKRYRADLIVKDVVVELKSVSIFTSEHRAQLFNYLRLTRQSRGILMNFGGTSFAAERYFYLEETDNFIMLKGDNFMNYIE